MKHSPNGPCASFCSMDLRLVKNEYIFYKRNSKLSRSVQYTNGSEPMFRLNMQRHTQNLVGWLQRTVKKCTKNYNARAQPLSRDALVAVNMLGAFSAVEQSLQCLLQATQVRCYITQVNVSMRTGPKLFQPDFFCAQIILIGLPQVALYCTSPRPR